MKRLYRKLLSAYANLWFSGQFFSILAALLLVIPFVVCVMIIAVLDGIGDWLAGDNGDEND